MTEFSERARALDRASDSLEESAKMAMTSSLITGVDLDLEAATEGRSE